MKKYHKKAEKKNYFFKEIAKHRVFDYILAVRLFKSARPASNRNTKEKIAKEHRKRCAFHVKIANFSRFLVGDMWEDAPRGIGKGNLRFSGRICWFSLLFRSFLEVFGEFIDKFLKIEVQLIGLSRKNKKKSPESHGKGVKYLKTVVEEQ